MLLAILQISSDCYTVIIAQSSKSGCSWGNVEGGCHKEQHPPGQSFDRPGCVSQLSCTGAARVTPVQFCLSEKWRTHAGKGCLTPGAVAAPMSWATEWLGTEEKVPHTFSVYLAKPQLGTFGTHGHTGTAPRYGSVKSGCGFSPTVHGGTCPQDARAGHPTVHQQYSPRLHPSSQACLLFTGLWMGHRKATRASRTLQQGQD